MNAKYSYTVKELKEPLSSIVILVEREQQNDHIIDYLDKQKILYNATKR